MTTILTKTFKDGTTGIEYLDVYREMLAHQRYHSRLLPLPGRPDQPRWLCHGCLIESRPGIAEADDIRRRYSFAVPSPAAVDAIAQHSPSGVVEIGAGGGYWAMLLQQRGVDVIAYDPQPPPGESRWHTGRAWTAVHKGDHTMAAEHPTRTLLLCWPSYDKPWPARALECYTGDTVVYIGEGYGGCTGDNRMHALLGSPDCWCWDEPCQCDNPDPLYREITDVAIPQWSGIHDHLTVYRRIVR